VDDLVTVFRTGSDVEASVVRALLEAHGVPAVVASHLPQSVFPMMVNTLANPSASAIVLDAAAKRVSKMSCFIER